MAARGLLLWAAVPVTPELERRAGRQRHVHELLRWDAVLSRVFCHVQATAARSCRDVGTLTSEDELLPRASLSGDSANSLPDLIQTCQPSLASPPDVMDEHTAPPPPAPAEPLAWTLQLVVSHLRLAARLPWKARPSCGRDPGRGRGARPPAAGRGHRQGADRSGACSVSATLRHVGQELRRIADQFQLSRLVGWRSREDALREAISSHPLLSGVVGCAVICGLSALLGRALRR